MATPAFGSPPGNPLHDSIGNLLAEPPRRPPVSARATAPALTAPRAARRTTFWLASWLAVLMVLTKAAHFGLPRGSQDRPRLDYFRDVAVSSAADVVFALGLGVGGQLLLSLTRRRVKLHRAAWAALVALGVSCASYTVFSAFLFQYVGAPLTYPLLYTAGDASNMRSSVAAFITPTRVALLLGIPLAYYWLVRDPKPSARPAPALNQMILRALQAAGILLIVAYARFSARTVAGLWSDRPDWRISENPHWAFVSSLWTHSTSRRTIQLGEKYPPQDLRDFQTVAERHGGAGGVPGSTLPPVARPKNVILVVLESCSTKYMSVFGSKYPTTPCLDAEAGNALLFSNCSSHVGNTANSLAAVTLSMYPGMSWRRLTVEQPDLKGVSLGDCLKPRGYRTAFISSGDNAYANQDGFLERRGFDDVWDYRKLDAGPRLFSWGVEDRAMVDAMVRWIDRDPAEPFYILSWTQQTHHPYETTPGQELIDFFQGDGDPPPDTYDLNNYLNCLREADRQVGRLFDALRQRGLADDTLVIVTGDHGEAFGVPHGVYGHTGTVFQENINVPLMVWNPKLFGPAAPAARRPETICGHIDLNPTVLDVLGFPSPPGWQGRSLFDPARPPRAYFFGDKDGVLGVRETHWKYTYNNSKKREALYDLAADPDEQKNLAATLPDRCARFRQRLSAWGVYEEQYFTRLQRHE